MIGCSQSTFMEDLIIINLDKCFFIWNGSPLAEDKTESLPVIHTKYESHHRFVAISAIHNFDQKQKQKTKKAK